MDSIYTVEKNIRPTRDLGCDYRNEEWQKLSKIHRKNKTDIHTISTVKIQQTPTKRIASL